MSKVYADGRLEPLRRMLQRRKILPHPLFGDYGDYIEANEYKKVIGGFPDILPEGSMHLALRRTASTKKFR